MSANKLALDRLRRKYRDHVTAREFDKAVDVLTDVGKIYYKMYQAKEQVPEHFLDPGDDLL